MKAWTVSDDEHSEIVFAESESDARVRGAGLLGVDSDDVARCARSPEFDQYGSRRAITAEGCIRNGWWFSCAGCECRVDADGGPEDQREEGDEDTGPSYHLYHPKLAWCSDRCRDADLAERFERRAGECALHEQVVNEAQRRWPGLLVLRTDIYWSRDRQDATVHFTVPGQAAGDEVSWKLGLNIVRVSSRGVPAWNTFTESLKDQRRVST